jgi:hypothetical protein
MIIFNNLGHGTYAPFDVPVHVNSCDLSGFRAKPGELVRTRDGLYTLPEFAESKHMSDFIQYRVSKLKKGPLRREPVGDETFIDTPVTIDDL